MNLDRTRSIEAGGGSVPGLERMYTPAEIAEWLQVDRSTVTRWFSKWPGVVRLGSQKYSTIRVPASVLEKFIQDRSR